MCISKILTKIRGGEGVDPTRQGEACSPVGWLRGSGGCGRAVGACRERTCLCHVPEDAVGMSWAISGFGLRCAVIVVHSGADLEVANAAERLVLYEYC